MKDPNIQVKDLAAWTLGRVCEHVPETMLNEQYLLPLLNALVDLDGRHRCFGEGPTQVCRIGDEVSVFVT